MFADKTPRKRIDLWQRPDWPQWRYDATALAGPLAQLHRAQGELVGRMAHLGLAQRDLATLQALTQEVITTSAIEGETLNLEAVRSSIARRLGVDIGALAPADRHVDGVVDMVLDATQQHAQPLTAERLFGWHAALFPTGFSGRVRIQVGTWRNDAAGRCRWSRVRWAEKRCTLRHHPPTPCPLKQPRFWNGSTPGRWVMRWCTRVWRTCGW